MPRRKRGVHNNDNDNDSNGENNDSPAPESPEPDGTGYHTPLWPAYVPSGTKLPSRTLCLLRYDGRLQSEHGELFSVESAAELCELGFALNAIVYTGPLESSIGPDGGEWFYELLQQSKATRGERPHKQWVEPLVSPHSKRIVSLAIHRHPRVLKLVFAGAWGQRAAEPSLLADLRRVFDLCGVGDHATPAGLGYARMLREYRLAAERGEKWERHHRPKMQCVRALENNAVGARKESYRPMDIFEQAWETDRTNGYAAECYELPAGTVRYTPNATADVLPTNNPKLRCFAWWALCYVKIRAPGITGGDILPLAVWNADTQEWDWPTAPGGYLCYLWSFEAAEIERRARDEGAPVEIQGVSECWYWDGSCRQLSGWAAGMHALRRQAEATAAAPEAGKAVADLVKCATTGAIGRLGMEYATYTVVTEAEAEEGDEQVQTPDTPYTGLWLRRTPADTGMPSHWHKYILARQNFSLYTFQRAVWRERGIMPVATNTDGLFYAADPGAGVEPAAAGLGDYKRRYRGAFLSAPARGTVITPDKIATPGLPRSDQQRILRYGEKRNPGRKPSSMERARAGAAGEIRAATRAECLRLTEHYWKQQQRKAGGT